MPRLSRCSTASAPSCPRARPLCSPLFALIGLLAILQGIMFAYGRNMYSLSRAGYYPKFLSLTGERQTPYVALLVGAVIGFIALVDRRNANASAGDDRAQHRSLGCGAGLHAADDLVRAAAAKVPERPAAVDQPDRKRRGDRRVHHRGDHVRRLS